MSYRLRERALHDDLHRYTCCGGFFPCSGRCGEQKCPEFCLALESCCCFGTSVAATRFIIQDELQLQNTKTDLCLFGTQFAISQCACVCGLAACILGSDELNSLSQCLYLVSDIGFTLLCGCLQAQHYHMLEARDAAEAAMPRTILTPPPIAGPMAYNPIYSATVAAKETGETPLPPPPTKPPPGKA